MASSVGDSRNLLVSLLGHPQDFAALRLEAATTGYVSTSGNARVADTLVCGFRPHMARRRAYYSFDGARGKRLYCLCRLGTCRVGSAGVPGVLIPA